MIETLTIKESDDISQIINQAAIAYKGHIPEDRYHEPYMPREELNREMGQMIFFGWQEKHKLVGVMGFQPIKDVTLIRHAYILPEYQRFGIGGRLLEHLKQATKTERLLVGTWEAASWAINFYQKHGFILLPNKEELLKKYWDIPERQIETSVVLGIEMKHNE